MIQRALLVVLSVLLAPAGVAAEGLYAQLEGGASFVTDSDLDTDAGISGEGSFDTGFNVGGAVGYRFAESFRAEIAVNYRQADVDEIDDTPLGTLEGAGDVGVVGAMANGYFDVDLDGPVSPYLGAGIGLGVVIVDSDSSANLLIVDDETTTFAWNAMGGISFDASDNLVLSVGYRYFSTTEATLDATISGFGPTELDAETGAHEVVAGLRYEF